MEVEGIAEALRRIEQRIEALEQWQRRVDSVSPAPAVSRSEAPRLAAEDIAAKPLIHDLPATPAPALSLPLESEAMELDLSLIGRTLIVFGGAYLLRAVTDAGYLASAVGVLVGLVYAVMWSVLALRSTATRSSALHHGIATTFISLPLVFEATRRFEIFGAWSAMAALAAASAIVLAMAWHRRLAGLAWTFTLATLALVPLLMAQTNAIVPFALYLTGLGVATVWIAYTLEWRLLRWAVALEVDLVLALLAFLVVTDRLPGVSPATAIAVSCIAFAAYLATFAVRTLVRQRDVIAFEIVQTAAVFVSAIGGAMWIAASKSTLEMPLAIAMFALAVATYAVSFAFVPRGSTKPANFVFYSSLALLLIVSGGSFMTSGLANNALWVLLALTSAYLASHYRKASLALHSAVYLFSGFVGAGVLDLGLHSMFLRIEHGWPIPEEGAILLLFATAMVATIRPIERLGTFQLWAAAKVIILAELSWIAGALILSSMGSILLDEANPDAALVAVARTTLLAGLTVLTAWASRFATLAPARFLSVSVLGILVLKLMWEDFRFGRPATLFVSLAMVGVALILTARFRRRPNGLAPGAAIEAL